MAIVKKLKKSTLSVEYERGIDKTGGPIYGKKNFAGLKSDASAEAINDVAEGISDILAKNTRCFLVNDISYIEEE